MKGIILSKTRGSIGVVELISRYVARPSRNVPWILKRPSLNLSSSSTTAAEKDLGVVVHNDRAAEEGERVAAEEEADAAVAAARL